MPWRDCTVVEERLRFVVLAQRRGEPFSLLCAEFGISRKTGYKWLRRYNQRGLDGLTDRSRRPRHSPGRISTEIERRIVELREQYPFWGARKLQVRLSKDAVHVGVSTVGRVLKRYGLIGAKADEKADVKRFARQEANELWQMDFKGEWWLGPGRKCYPLTVLDDCTRFNVGLWALGSQTAQKVKDRLERMFRQYGMPGQMLTDRGTPWYSAHGEHGWTKLSVWLMRLGIELLRSAAYHPETIGKEERFHRTLHWELVSRERWSSHEQWQMAFEQFRHRYNYVRPHEALQMRTPGELYTPSERRFPDKLPELQYPSGSRVRKVNERGLISYGAKSWFISEALAGEHVLIEENDKGFDVRFMNTVVKTVVPKCNLCPEHVCYP